MTNDECEINPDKPTDMYKGCQIKGVIFDCYQTLIDIHTEEHEHETHKFLSAWLDYHGVRISPDELWDTYLYKVNDRMKHSSERFPEIKVEEIFTEICKEHAVWKIDSKKLGIETSKAFRAASIRKLRVFPQTIQLIEHYANVPKCIVSNGQRVFSELELRFLGLYDYFDFVIFSSDVGYQKPDLRMFTNALKKMGLEAEPRSVMSIGDSNENELEPAEKIGMHAMHIEEAWKHFGITD
jgi:putative hydrolase of the HAD superfamily